MATTYNLGGRKLNTSQMAKVSNRLKDLYKTGKYSKEQYDRMKKQIQTSVYGPQVQNKITPVNNIESNITPTEPNNNNITPTPTEPINNNITPTGTEMVDTPGNTIYSGSMGDMSIANVDTASKFEATLAAQKKATEEAAKRKAEIEMEIAKEKQKVIGERDADKIKRLEAQEQKLNQIESKYTADMGQRKSDADEIFRRQDQIATREAGIAAAQAGESGLQLTAGALEDIRGEVIGKYGENLLNADQFRMQTNMTIDNALKDTGLEIFSKQSEIDNFKNGLADEQFAPVLNALDKAAEGDTQAIDDVEEFYKQFRQKKADEEYTQVAIQERLASQERIWQGASPAKRLAILQDQFREDGIMDVFIGDVEKFTNMTYAEAYNTVMKDKNNIDIMKEIIAAASSGGHYDTLPEEFKRYGVELGLAAGGSQSRQNLPATDKKDVVLTDPNMTGTTGGTVEVPITPTPPVTPVTLPPKAIEQLDRIKKSGKIKAAIKLIDKSYSEGNFKKPVYDAMISYLNS